jgi:hypothetical protein
MPDYSSFKHVHLSLPDDQGGWTDTQDLHRCLTLGALKGRLGAQRTGLYQKLQDQLNQGQQLLGVTMQKTIVSGSAKAFGQNMLQGQPQEVFAFDSAAEGLAGVLQ